MPKGTNERTHESATDQVTLLVPVDESATIPLAAHHGVFLGALERELRSRGQYLVLRGVAGPGELAAQLKRVQGAAVLLGFRDDELEALPPGAKPLIAVDSYAESSALTIVRADDFSGGGHAATLLATYGHRDMLLVGPSPGGSGVASARERGFTQAITTVPGVTLGRCVTTGTTYLEGVSLGRRLPALHPGATAVFAFADTLAAGLMDGLAQARIRVPDDISVLGFDNIEPSTHTAPRLSTVAQDIQRKATLAADVIVSIPDELAEHISPLTVDTHVIDRGSVRALRR
ncbi:LacI family DNA-binding transcriptional regulator [Humibacter ginsenosidimutans]|uniref:LacI family transcriptional regulator n=1 Tax=Humibacter ginsenosidimutans TaxID=2599293 RepID=A0A5B8M7M2_9MICO|nr:LacI family DNA-binding transcriptional regulator [Humibacter ginsenosidimutans]QDZ16004.1 LacI family transcriptional regulator [Humibacter ginsenosidimutans]